MIEQIKEEPMKEYYIENIINEVKYVFKGHDLRTIRKLVKQGYDKGRKQTLKEFFNLIEKEWIMTEDDLPYFEKGDVFIGKKDWEQIQKEMSNG